MSHQRCKNYSLYNLTYTLKIRVWLVLAKLGSFASLTHIADRNKNRLLSDTHSQIFMSILVLILKLTVQKTS